MLANKFWQVVILVLLLVGCNKFGFMSFGGGGGGGADKKPQPVTANNTRSTVENFAPQVSSQKLLDILLVIDNSSSMYRAHQKLSKKLSELWSNVNESDWRIAITTSDPRDCVKTIIDKQTTNYQQVFDQAISLLKADSTTHDQPIRMAIAGLKGDCAKKLWLRDNSMVVVLIVTNEDNYYLQCGDVDHDEKKDVVITEALDPKQCHVEALYRYLEEIRIPRVTAKVYGLLNDKKKTIFMAWRDKQGKSIFDHVGHLYLRGTNSNDNIADYGEVLRKISHNISSTLQKTYVLKNKTNVKIEKIVVTHQLGKRNLMTGEYQVEGNVLTITSDLPLATTDIEVTYQQIK